MLKAMRLYKAASKNMNSFAQYSRGKCRLAPFVSAVTEKATNCGNFFEFKIEIINLIHVLFSLVDETNEKTVKG